MLPYFFNGAQGDCVSLSSRVEAENSEFPSGPVES